MGYIRYRGILGQITYSYMKHYPGMTMTCVMRKKVVPRLPQIFERSVSIMVYFLCSLFGFALSVAKLLDGSANFFRVDRDREN